jgi:hypothetical protein
MGSKDASTGESERGSAAQDALLRTAARQFHALSVRIDLWGALGQQLTSRSFDLRGVRRARGCRARPTSYEEVRRVPDSKAKLGIDTRFR